MLNKEGVHMNICTINNEVIHARTSFMIDIAQPVCKNSKQSSINYDVFM